MDVIAKISIWAVILVLVGGQLNHFLQSTMIDAGIMSKKVKMSDACKFEVLPKWFKDVMQCEEKDRKSISEKTKMPKLDLKLDLDDDLLQDIRFENREKTPIEKVIECVNSCFAYLQRLILPENFVMPCILGDCNMDKKIKLEKEKYANFIGRKVPVSPPEEPVDVKRTKPKTTP